ncbi:hypothetical protein AB0K14_39290 [Actinosynnema sp. NPDC050801]|uniref:hypothetical protein n=1 Tax=unclassified Actinosynnema TaxID=2637065 RepID=UPI0033DF48F8
MHEQTVHEHADHEPAVREPVDHDPADHDPTAHEQAAHEQAGSEYEPVEREPVDRDQVDPTRTDDEQVGHGPVGNDPVGHEQPDHERTGQEQHTSEPTELYGTSTTAGDAPLFTTDDAADYQAEWRALQADFVDDPREAVQRADELVAQVMQTLATTFTDHKHALEEQWQRGDEVQTEELRQALKRYRSFFDRLLSV